MITAMTSENSLFKIHCPFKIFNKNNNNNNKEPRVQMNCLGLTSSALKKKVPDTCTSWRGLLEAFPLKLGMREGCLQSPLIFSMVLEKLIM